jgi:protein-disulfide isomerase
MRAAAAAFVVLVACGGKGPAADEGGGLAGARGDDAMVQVGPGAGDPTAAAARLDAVVEHELAGLDRALDTAPVGPGLADPRRRVRVVVTADGKPPITPISLTMFYELACPHCATARLAVAELLARYPGKITVVPRVMIVHRVPAMTAHLVACAAGGRGVDVTEDIWTKAYEPADFSAANLLAIAAARGVAAEDVLTALGTGACGAAIRADAVLGRGLGVRGTPTFLVNGLPIEGLDPAGLAALVDAELARADAFVAAGGTIAGFHQDWWQQAR